MLCTPELAAEIAKSPGAFVSVSLDGADAATHEWVRGVKGSFELAVQGVRNLVAAGIRPQIIMSMMRGNAGQVEAMVRLAESLGAASVKFNIIQPTGRGEKVREASDGLDVAELIELGRWVDMELAQTTPLKLHFDYPLAFRPLSRIASENGGGTCGILGILGVLAHRPLRPVRHRRAGAGAGVRPGGRRSAGRGCGGRTAVLNELRAGLPDRLGGVCGRCLMKQRCLGSCVAQNYYQTQTLLDSHWFCQAAGQANLFPFSRRTDGIGHPRNPTKAAT